MPEVEARIEAPAKRGSVPDTAKPAAKRAGRADRAGNGAEDASRRDGSRHRAAARSPQPAEARVFVPSHAPDDPGPEEVEPDDVTLPLRPQRA